MSLCWLVFCNHLHAATFTHLYDKLSRITNAAYSDGSRESYSYDAAGNRLSRITLAATTPADSTPPSIPTNFVSLTFTPSQLSVGWNRSYDTGGSGLAGYFVYTNGEVATTTTSTNFLIGDLASGAEYCLTVAAYDRATNISAFTPPLCFATSSTNDLLPPILTVLSPTNGSIFLTNFVLLTGTATDSSRGNNGIANIVANGQPASDAATSLSSTSQWSVLVSLSPGYNPIRVVASDASLSQNHATNDLMLIRGLASNEPPAVVASRVSSDSQFETTLVGYLGSTYGVWASSNLLSWMLVTNVTLTNWVQDVAHLEANNYPQRFYRFSAPSAGNGVPSAPALLLKQTGLPITVQPLAVGDNGFLFGATSAGIFAIDSSSLTLVWGTVKPAACSGFPIVPVSVTASGIVFGVADWNECRNGRLVAYSAANGAFLWEYDGDGPHPRHVAAIDEVNNVLYHGSTPFLAYNYVSQSQSWQRSDGYYIGGRGIAIDQPGNVYIAWFNGSGGSGRMRSYDSGGTLRWNKEFSGPDWPYILAVVSPSTLLVEYDGNLEARDAATGDVVWQTGDFDNPVTDTSGNSYCNVASSPQIVSLNSVGVERWRVNVC